MGSRFPTGFNMRSLMVMSFVCALFVAIIHANKDDASKRPRIPLPPTMAFLEDIVKQAKPETSEQAAARKAALPAHNQKMREAAAAAAERYKNGGAKEIVKSHPEVESS